MLGLLAGCVAPVAAPSPSAAPTAVPTTYPPATTKPTAISEARAKIKHIVVIMQENRSFDQYFGTYPGADGIPMQGGIPTVCVTDPKTNACVKPYHDTKDVDSGGPHAANSATADIDGGKMDGFIETFRKAQRACKNPDTPGCVNGETPDVMGWHDAREIPNYWTYAQSFVLQDKMFEPNASWSLPSHLFLVSAWSAKCATAGDPASCANALDGPSSLNVTGNDYAWTDLTFLLHRANVSWAYYLSDGSQLADLVLRHDPTHRREGTGLRRGVVLVAFDTVKQDGQLANIQTVVLDVESAGIEVFVAEERRYATAKLMGDVGALLPHGMFATLPPIAQKDLSEAGQALVYGLGTAAAFHAVRATEELLRMTYRTWTPPKSQMKKPWLWKPMLDQLRLQQKGPPIVVLDNLDYLRRTFRNPTDHPELTYDIDEGQELFAACLQSIAVMKRACDQHDADRARLSAARKRAARA